jgi:hypothetical protein
LEKACLAFDNGVVFDIFLPVALKLSLTATDADLNLVQLGPAGVLPLVYY